MQVTPISAYQINSYRSSKNAYSAIDGDLSTNSHTNCAWNKDLWYKIKFDTIYCISEVVIIQSHMQRQNAKRMEDSKVFIVNTVKGTESLCGVLKIKSTMTLEEQTYKIPCDLNCGDEVRLTLRHDHGKYSSPACIHMFEIMAFFKGL